MSPARAAQQWPLAQLCSGWLGLSASPSLCGVDRLVTMAEGNTLLYGSQMLAGGRQTLLDPALVVKLPDPFDFRVDILIPTATDTFSRPGSGSYLARVAHFMLLGLGWSQ